MKGEKALPPKGTRDFGPAVMAKRNWIIDRIREGYRKFGFSELQTPAMENLSVLLGKYGLEGDKLIYKILNSGQYLGKDKEDGVSSSDLEQGESAVTKKISEKGLRYDLTVPFARYVAANHKELSFPFKRHQIQPVWRADRPQKGRFREFWQCDADTVGSSSLFSDAELIIMAHEILFSLGIDNFRFLINHRSILEGVAELCAPNLELSQFTGTLDKLDKIGKEKVFEQLQQQGVEQSGIDSLNRYLDFSDIREIEQGFKDESPESALAAGIQDLKRIMGLVEKGSQNSGLVFDPSLARGLDYYTGSIFEIVIPDSGVGSICGGGRYDNLTGIFGVPGIPGVGLSFGLDRLYEYFESKGLFPENNSGSPEFIVCHVDRESMEGAWTLWAKLSQSGISGFVYPETAKIKKQFQYADRNNIQFVIVVGPDEIQQERYSLKDLRSGEQFSFSIDELIEKIHG